MENIVYNEIDNDDDGEMNYMKFVVKDRDTQKQLENYLQEISNKYFDQVDEEDLDYVFNVSVFQDIEEFITTFSVPFDDEINYEIIESIEEKFGDSVKNVPYYYAKGGFLGGIFGGKRTYKKGLAYKLDRAKHNKSEDWEVPMKNRKKRYANGGGVETLYDSEAVDNWTIKDYDQILSIVQKLKDEGYSNKDNVELTETFNGKRIELDFYYSTEGDWELYIDVPLSIIQILSKYLAFDKVSGDYTNFNVDFDFYKIRANNSKELVCSINGDWDKSEMPSVIEIKTEQGYIESSYFNSYPRGSFGDFDETQFEKNLKNALNEIKQKNLYSAVVSLEGYEQYSEKVDGLENAKQAIQDIKENTRFQVVKGDVASGDLIKQDEVIENYANGGGVSNNNSDWNPDYCKCIKDIRFKDSLNFFEGFEYTYDEDKYSIRVYYMDGRGVTMSKETFDKHFEKIGKDKDKLTYANGGGVNKNWDSFYNGGGIDETVIVYAENKDGHRKIISEHKSVNSAKNKIKKISNEVFNDSNIESIGTMGKIEFEKHYKDFTFSNGGGVDEIRMFHNGVFYKLGYSEEDNFYIKDFQEDSLKGFKEVGFDTEREARDYAEELIDSKYANDKTYGELYNKIVLAVMKDIKVSREKAEDIVNKNEGWLTDMIEYEGETNVTFLADQITTTDEGLYANGGGVEDYDYYGSMTDESVVMQNCSNGEIHCDILEEIIGSKPEYPYQQVGSIRLQKCYLRPYYKIS
jgi:hypothetical protein